jgi:hypothetical protein
VELDAFTNRLGTGQGRLGAPSGAFEFVLGDAEAGRFASLVPGDRTGLTQDVDLAGIDFIRLQGVLRVQKSLPEGLAWEASIVVDGGTHARVRCPSGRRRQLTDVAANVSKLNGVHTVEVRLELVVA